MRLQLQSLAAGDVLYLRGLADAERANRAKDSAAVDRDMAIAIAYEESKKRVLCE